MVDTTEQTALFDFMVVRAPEEIPDLPMRQRYIRDIGMDSPPMLAVAGNGVAGLPAVSRIASLVAGQVRGWEGDPGAPAALDGLRAAIIADADRLGMARRGPIGQKPAAGPPALTLGELEAGAHLTVSPGEHYLLPDRLERLNLPFSANGLVTAGRLLDDAARSIGTARTTDLITGLTEALAGVLGSSVDAYVFTTGDGVHPWHTVHRRSFDALYLTYILRRWTTVNLEPTIATLRTLHALLALATDVVVAAVTARPSLPDPLRQRLEQATLFWPQLAGWNRRERPDGFPLVPSRAALAELLSARPLIHPLFARLFWYLRPFNAIRPIGVGDLKVVRQWITAYRPGEISHVHNIVKGETRTRDHRRLERTEETFSYTDSSAEDLTRDQQSTQRFELKAEAENVIRTTLNVNASANTTLSYGNETSMKVTASVGAGFAYTRAGEDHRKTAETFARDVVDKAVSRVESRTVTTRSTTKLYETEEKNGQVFDNRKGERHVSGIYRWIDKEYTAQLFNYGRRMMFEFTVPEPAAFWIGARLRGFEAELDVPQPPRKPSYETVNIGFTAAEIDEGTYRDLRGRYDLSALKPPVREKTLGLRITGTGGRYFEERDVSGANHTRQYDCQVAGIKGYTVKTVWVRGLGQFHHRRPGNAVTLDLDGRLVRSEARPDVGDWVFDEAWTPAESIQFTSDDTTVGFSFREEILWYSIQATLVLSAQDAWTSWQDSVYDVVRQTEEAWVADANRKLEQAYEAELADYRNAIGQLDAVRVADVLQGGPEAANRAIIAEEIKKHCLTLLTKEFDTVATDDLMSDESAMGSRSVKPVSTRFAITKNGHRTVAGFRHPRPATMDYPAIDIGAARTKGRVVQFLEQGFEWERLSYVFYPYFWSKQTRWVELMNRTDVADATFAAFLRAGMARVLVAVTPGYDDAVLHYLATREPWDGGPSPVIGDPLFIPLHEEIRQQQDDLYGGSPEGEPWTFTVPTSLVYLHGSADPLPDIAKEREGRANGAPAADTADAAPDRTHG
jgi:hypothetical protein